MFLLAQFGSGFFVRIFTRDAFYIEKTVGFIRIYTLGVIPLAVQYAIVDGFTGMGIAKAALPLSFARKGIYIGLVIALCVWTVSYTHLMAKERVFIAGKAVLYSSAELFLPEEFKR